MVYILQSLNQTQEKFDDLPNLQMVMCLVILNNERYLEITWVCLKLGDVPILGNQIMEKAMVIHQWIWRLPIFKQTWIVNMNLDIRNDLGVIAELIDISQNWDVWRDVSLALQ